MNRTPLPLPKPAHRRRRPGNVVRPSAIPCRTDGFVSVLPLLFLLFALLFFPAPDAPAKGAGPQLPHPGFRSVGLWDPDIPIRMDIAVWYPSPRIPRDLLLDGWSIRVGQNGITIPGRYPVILISHTTAASRLASHDLAAALARHGFMVIAPTHPKDNMDDTSGIFHAALFADRPRQLLLALEAVERNATLRHIMDRSRVGILGVGAGAATALQLAGARPDLSLLGRHCTLPENAVSSDPLCSTWAQLFHPRMQAEFAALLAGGPEKFTPVLYAKAEPLTGDASLNDLSHALSQDNRPSPAGPPSPQEGPPLRPAALSANGAPQPPSRKVEAPQTQPVLAVGLLTPGLIDLFPDTALQGVTVPVGILAVSNDAVYPAEKSVDRLQLLLPQRPASRVLQNAGHVDMQAPCPPMYQESFSALCGSLNPVAEDWRKIRNDFFVRFFQKNLGPPGPPPLLLPQ